MVCLGLTTIEFRQIDRGMSSPDRVARLQLHQRRFALENFIDEFAEAGGKTRFAATVFRENESAFVNISLQLLSVKRLLAFLTCPKTW